MKHIFFWLATHVSNEEMDPERRLYRHIKPWSFGIYDLAKSRVQLIKDPN